MSGAFTAFYHRLIFTALAAHPDTLPHILLIDGPDRPGLIYHVTGLMYRHGLNIIRNDEYVSPDKQFFMRTEFEGKLNADALLADLQAMPMAAELGTNFRLQAATRKRVVVLVTKEHHCLAELLVRHAFDELGAEIVAVISNYSTLQPFVETFGVPYHALSHEGISRQAHEQAVLELLAQYKPDYVVLAKYMRVLSAQFVGHYPNRIINIHHSFLPAFVGANPYRQAYERGVKIIGATAHFVNDDLDEGPIIAQDVTEVNHRQSAADMARQGRDVEKIVLSKALRLVFSDRVFIAGRRVIVF